MTFRDLVLENDVNIRPSFRQTENKTLWEVLVDNNGPVMTLWFVVMVANILGLVFLF